MSQVVPFNITIIGENYVPRETGIFQFNISLNCLSPCKTCKDLFNSCLTCVENFLLQNTTCINVETINTTEVKP